EVEVVAEESQGARHPRPREVAARVALRVDHEVRQDAGGLLPGALADDAAARVARQAGAGPAEAAVEPVRAQSALRLALRDREDVAMAEVLDIGRAAACVDALRPAQRRARLDLDALADADRREV